MYAQINIGRNIADVPMPAERWQAFIRGAERIMLAYVGGSSAEVEIHEGHGRWADVPEESAHISTFIDRDLGTEWLERQVSRLCEEYEQDSIALIVTSGSKLVTAATGRELDTLAQIAQEARDLVDFG